VIDRVPAFGPRAAYVKQELRDKLIDHKNWITVHGDDMPEIRDWKWGQVVAGGAAGGDGDSGTGSASGGGSGGSTGGARGGATGGATGGARGSSDTGSDNS